LPKKFWTSLLEGDFWTSNSNNPIPTIKRKLNKTNLSFVTFPTYPGLNFFSFQASSTKSAAEQQCEKGEDPLK